MTERYPLRPITPEEFDTYCEVTVQAFNDSDAPAELNEHERLVFEFDRSIAAFDGDAIVGTTAAYSFQLTVPGGITGAAGVTFVSVLPSHRRRGILSAMMRHQLADIAARGEAVAALYASETGIYGRYGYGCASWQLEPDDPPRRGRTEPGRDRQHGSWRRGGGRARPRPGAAVRAAPAGQLGRAGPGCTTWRGRTAPDDGPGRPRWRPWSTTRSASAGDGPQKCLLAVDDSGPLGLCPVPDKAGLGRRRPALGSPGGARAVRHRSRATAALWSDLLNRDLIGEVTARNRPVDDPLLDMLADRRRARAQVTDGLWVRLTDVPAALRQRVYSSAADVVIEVRDGLLPGNAGRWRLQCPGPGEGEARPAVSAPRPRRTLRCRWPRSARVTWAAPG